jgi:3-hydroxyacyl-CoA dehydrogenase
MEATRESFESKSKALQLSSWVVSDVAVLMTKTSSLTIDFLSKCFSALEKSMDLHFFKPTSCDSLVEGYAPNERPVSLMHY